MMSLSTWLRTPRIRRGLAASIVVLCAGGLVLTRTPASARPTIVFGTAKGDNRATFSGAGAHGSLALSHTKVLANGVQQVYAELKLAADPAERGERAPLSLVVVLDTSGSMTGEKIEQAKSSVIQLIDEMKDDDEIALVRYASDSEIIQPLTRVGAVRRELAARVSRLGAGGGTNIPLGLSRGASTLTDATRGRVKRVVLVSDGLDSTRAEAERLAENSAESGITVSSLGIGLDFDEAYMGAVARAGHGNHGFVRDGAALATFLRRELTETALTTIDSASARLKLPPQLRFVRAVGAQSSPLGGGEIELRLGSIFAGDERRVIVELTASVETGEAAGIDGQVVWSQVGGEATQARVATLTLSGSNDAREVEEGRDGSVFASATSALASVRQLEAAEAFARGDTARANEMIDQNLAQLGAAAPLAPEAAASALAMQQEEYRKVRRDMAKAPLPMAKAAAKSLAEKDVNNTARAGF